MLALPASTRVNSVRNDDSGLLSPDDALALKSSQAPAAELAARRNSGQNTGSPSSTGSTKAFRSFPLRTRHVPPRARRFL